MKHQKILDRLFKSMEEEANKDNTQRTYLGMSSFGGCDRKQWLSFRHAYTPFINYQSASHFFDGHKTEKTIGDRFLAAGFDFKPVDEDGNQFTFIDGFTRGHSDGEFVWDGEKYVWEMKSTDKQKRDKLEKLIAKDEHSALEKWSPLYYNQSQFYMGYSGIHKHILFASAHGGRERKNSKGDYRTIVVETLFDEVKFKELQEKAKNIIATDKMPEASWALAVSKPLCIWGSESYQSCEAYKFCTGKDISEPDCFNCSYITFLETGMGHCFLSKKEIKPYDMQGFKPCHKYHPSLIVGYDLICQNEDGSVLYRKDNGEEITNCDSRDFRKEFILKNNQQEK
jgi:hypothetical protein